MMIEIEQDIGKINESVFLGLSGRQTIYAGAGLFTGTGVMLLSYSFLGYYGAFIVAFFVAAPLFLQGFYQFQGLGFIQYVKLMIQNWVDGGKEYQFEGQDE